MSVASWMSGVGAAVAMVFWSPQVEAVAVVSFDQSGGITGGSISYDGTGGPLVGTAILFDTLRGVGTPLNAGATTLCLGCTLSFTTGGNVSEGATYSWGGAPLGSFVLMGTLPLLPPPGPVPPLPGPPVVLLTGTISFAEVSTGGLSVTLRGVDFKHPAIVDFFYGPGPDPEFSYVNTEIIIGGIDFDEPGDPGGADGGFTANVTNADIDNIVPEPGSALLLLLGLGSLAAYRRRS